MKKQIAILGSTGSIGKSLINEKATKVPLFFLNDLNFFLRAFNLLIIILIFGMILTIMVQSSSITTSTIWFPNLNDAELRMRLSSFCRTSSFRGKVFSSLYGSTYLRYSRWLLICMVKDAVKFSFHTHKLTSINRSTPIGRGLDYQKHESTHVQKGHFSPSTND